VNSPFYRQTSSILILSLPLSASDVARIDATFVCFNIDLDIGQINHKEAYDAFAYEGEEDDSVDPEEELDYGMSGLYRSDSGHSV
jgi:hypothetical protein